MIINSKTKVSQLITAYPMAIELLIEVNSNFSKLRNPFLRKLLASRVNLSDAAKIGGADVNSILKKLHEAGLEVELNLGENYHQNIINQSNSYMSDRITLDVRPILEKGVDPFNIIMDTIKKMDTEKQELLIINTFEPIPIINILKKKGFSSIAERMGGGEVHTTIFKLSEDLGNTSEKPRLEGFTYSEAEKIYYGKLVEIDVRPLEMPLPMVTILEELEKLPNDCALFVRHKKLPQYLIPELEERGWEFASQEIDSLNINFIIYKR